MVVTLRLDVSVGHEENGEDDNDDIPTRENEPNKPFISEVHDAGSIRNLRECIRDRTHLLWRIPSRESNHGWNLQQTNLKSVRRSNFHTNPLCQLSR